MLSEICIALGELNILKIGRAKTQFAVEGPLGMPPYIAAMGYRYRYRYLGNNAMGAAR